MTLPTLCLCAEKYSRQIAVGWKVERRGLSRGEGRTCSDLGWSSKER